MRYFLYIDHSSSTAARVQDALPISILYSARWAIDRFLYKAVGRCQVHGSDFPYSIQYISMLRSIRDIDMVPHLASHIQSRRRHQNRDAGLICLHDPFGMFRFSSGPGKVPPPQEAYLAGLVRSVSMILVRLFDRRCTT